MARTFLLLSIIYTLILSCGDAHRSKSHLTEDGTLVKPTYSIIRHEGGIEMAPYNVKLINPDPKPFLDHPSDALKMPARPQRWLNFEKENHQDVSFQTGIKTSFLGSTLEVKTMVKFIREHSVATTVVVHGYEPVFVMDDDGKFFLNNKYDREMVYFCTISANLKVDESLAANISVFGNGVAGLNGLKQSTLVKQVSPLMVPSAGASWLDLRNTCEERIFNQTIVGIKSDLDVVIKRISYNNPLNECILDKHCTNILKDLPSSQQNKKVARCIPDEDRNRCELRSLARAACPVYKSSNDELSFEESPGFEKVSSQQFEAPCDKGLVCEVAQEGGWFTNWSFYSDWQGVCK